MKRFFLIGLALVLLSGLGYLLFSEQQTSDIRDEGRSVQSESHATSSMARVESTPSIEELKILIQKEGGRRETRLVKGQRGISPLPVLKIFSSGDGFSLLIPSTIIPEQETFFVLDEKTNILSKTTIPSSLFIGRAGTELFFFRSTRYGAQSYRTEINEIVAFDVKTEKERQVEILAEHLSYAKQIQEGTRLPKGTALLKDGFIRVEVYFESSHLFPGEERLPIEIHTIPIHPDIR